MHHFLSGMAQMELNSKAIEAFHFQEYLPPESVSHLVKSFFFMEVDRLPVANVHGEESFEVIVPFGCMDIILQSRGSFSLYNPLHARKEKLPLCFITPMGINPIYIKPEATVRLMGIRLWPWANRFFSSDKSARHLVFHPDTCHITESLEKEAAFLFNLPNDESIDMVSQMILDASGKKAAIDPVVKSLVMDIIANEGNINFGELTKRFQLSQRRIEQKFIEGVGICPKHFSRIVRFQSIFQVVGQMKRINFTNIVYECGYYDQAHFIRNFKEFTGLTPRKFFTSENLLSRLFLQPRMASFLLNGVECAA